MLDAIRRGPTTWNNQKQGLRFAERPRSAEAGFPARRACDHIGETNGIQAAPIDGAGSTLAITWVCNVTVASRRQPAHFEIEFDTGETWYNQSAGDPPSDTIDTQAVAAHEFGHATGFSRHWDYQDGANGSLCKTGDLAKHTMCATYEGGTVRQRTLEEHDIHTFAAAY